MADLVRKSVAFLVPEVTDGTLVKPTAATQGVALQDGFSLENELEQLANNELKSSIGEAATQVGIESPSFSGDHYLRASGVEGQEPNYSLYLESALGSAAVARGVERDTVAASTVSAINVDTGEGLEFSKGDALLVKHSAFTHEVRFVESVSSDVLTPGFNLLNAPATSTNLGLGVQWKPGEAHPAFSKWLYWASGSLVQAIAGNKVASASLSVEAGQFINASFETQGVEEFWNPLEVDATNFSLDLDDGGGEVQVSIEQKIYKSPIDLATEIQTKINAAAGFGDVATVTYSGNGKFTIASDGGTLSLLWNTGTNTATTIGSLLGFSVAADDTGATSYESDSAIDLTNEFIPDLDDLGPRVAKDSQFLIGDATDTACFEVQTMDVSIDNTIDDVLSVCAVSGVKEKAVTGRSIEVEVQAVFPKYDADKFNRLQKGQTVRWQYTFGNKSSAGGNWIPGETMAMYSGDSKIIALSASDDDGKMVMNLTLKPFVNDAAEGEFFLAQV